MIENFHFLRPYWFFLLPFLVLLLWRYYRRKPQSRSWQAVCDPDLLPHILVGPSEGQKGQRTVLVLSLCSGLALIALAGPAWKQLEQPVFRDQRALVLVLDLSRSMDAADIRPTRLIRARHKLIDILKARREGLTALVVFAAEAFVVSPLTQDSETIAAQISALNTDLMPKQGSRPDRAMRKAGALLAQAGAPRGRLLVVTDGQENVPPAELNDTLSELRQAGHSVYVLGVGTAEGAPIPLAEGGFVKDKTGAIVMAKLDEAGLMRMAQSGGGTYARLAVDDRDLRLLLADGPVAELSAPAETTDFKADQWQEEGPWLLLPLIPFAALAFRRGFFGIVLWMALSVAQPVYALDWDGLWSRPDQRGARQFAEGDTAAAATLFEDPQWKAASYYRAGQYQQSIEALSGIETPDAYYNKGNALAQLGRIPEAIAAYDEALKRAPDHEDARYNKAQLQQLSDPQEKQVGQEGEADGGQESEPSDQSRRMPPQDAVQNRQGEGAQEQTGAASDERRADGADAPQGAEQAENEEAGDAEREAQHAEASDSQEAQGDESSTRMAQSDLQEQDESQQANAQWLRRIPDDPGGLLRRKFLFQSQQRRGASSEAAEW